MTMDVDRNRLQSLIEADSYAALLGMRLGEGSGVNVQMEVDERHLNFLGGLHGGALFSLADCALSLASNHASTAVAIDTHMALTGRCEVGDVITASAEEISRGGRTGSYCITITRPDGRVIGVFTGTVLLV